MVSKSAKKAKSKNRAQGEEAQRRCRFNSARKRQRFDACKGTVRQGLRARAQEAPRRTGQAAGVGQAKGLKVCIVFEGRDGAGKGGTIKAITERVSPRVFRVVALPAPTEREKSQMYIQRYLPHLPAAGEVVIFDRSWYNRAGVERVMGFCTEEQGKRFLQVAPLFEKLMVNPASSCSSTGWR